MKIALIGVGKMGKAVAEHAQSKGHEIVLSVDALNQHELTSENLQKADVAIEFTRPDAVIGNLKKCLLAQIPVVCGTTGWHDAYDQVKDEFLSREGSLLSATNFSVGVNILFQLNIELSKWMNNQTAYHPYLREWHHTRKLDQPSGTAVTLANDLIHHHPETIAWQLTHSNEIPPDHVLGITSIREGEIIGTHELTWKSPIDQITIKHEAFSRDGFAAGAVLAAEWLIGRKGVFGMADVLFGNPNR